MATPKKLLSLLEKVGANYQIVTHRTVFTAFDAAVTQHLRVQMIVKILAVQLDKQPALVLLPGDKRLDFHALKKAVNLEIKKNITAVKSSRMVGARHALPLPLPSKPITKVSFMKEKQMVKIFKLSMKGKYIKSPVLPFGSFYKIPTIFDNNLLRQKRISLAAGSYRESVVFTPKEYIKVEKPLVAKIGVGK